MPYSVPASRARATRKLGLVLTGGTVGSEVDVTSRGPVVGLADHRRGDTPELALLEALIEGVGGVDVRIVRPIGALSENLVPDDWVGIAEAVRSLVDIDRVTGVLILHGTDTMAYTAAALSYLLADVQVPIVLTGSNLPPNQPDSDAAKNMSDALVAVSHVQAGTYIAFAGGMKSPGWVHLGTRVRKTRASGPAFVSVNRQPAGKVVGGGVYQPIHPLKQGWQPSRRLAIDARVLGLRLYPGLDFHAIAGMIESGAFSGVVLELYASATAPAGSGRYSAPEFVRFCRDLGIAVVSAVPAAPTGVPNLYQATIALEEAGAVFVHDMLPETALVKLMWVLAQAGSPETVESMMLDPIAEDLRTR